MQNLSIVIVDDAMFMRVLLKRIIEEAGFNVVGEGENGYEAINQAKIHQPDVLTLDITMPNMDGVSAVKEILKVSPKTKIIMVSAMGIQPLIIEAIKNGAKDFIVKPFEKTKVITAIKNAMQIEND